MTTGNKPKCVFCGKRTIIQFFTSIGTVFVHTECAIDLERMIAGKELARIEIAPQPVLVKKDEKQEF